MTGRYGFSVLCNLQDDSLSAVLFQDSVLDKLRKPENLNDLPLTLEVGLQPALEVDENLRRQADSIFDKEQFYLLEAANRKPKKKAELYVNDHG
jgi:mediator of replication checkpoint protein 1